MAASVARYYRVLGLPASASAKEIKSAYIDLCKRCHPDIVQSADPKEQETNKLKFQEIQEAYSQLMNKDGTKNDVINETNEYTSVRRAREAEWARQAGFPGQYETFRERTYHYQNPYIRNQCRRRPNQEEQFDFKQYYRKKYGEENFKKWSSGPTRPRGTEDYFDQSSEEFWRQRFWNEHYGYHRQKSQLGFAKDRIAAICILAFLVSNLVFYTLVVPDDSNRRPKSYW